MSEYYDVILGIIPLAFFGITGGLFATGFSTTTAVLAAGLVGVSLVGHALFVNGPVDRTPDATPTAAQNVSGAMNAPVDAE
ncbi:hypothetical protein [Salarchaeum sp. JOR-1]|uniref:hypothetical protein n=1 Tax=Salarchaeum sp. JOR-1 TaxID=2599399 RepID=UPI0011983696|nr:hypothetical protein [Salarchaeum sp. JOR-1]QDX41091.1 hypothetical protein FQU85_09340 [Salarchaeum sp. JOR-1]